MASINKNNDLTNHSPADNKSIKRQSSVNRDEFLKSEPQQIIQEAIKRKLDEDPSTENVNDKEVRLGREVKLDNLRSLIPVKSLPGFDNFLKPVVDEDSIEMEEVKLASKKCDSRKLGKSRKDELEDKVSFGRKYFKSFFDRHNQNQENLNHFGKFDDQFKRNHKTKHSLYTPGIEMNMIDERRLQKVNGRFKTEYCNENKNVARQSHLEDSSIRTEYVNVSGIELINKGETSTKYGISSFDTTFNISGVSTFIYGRKLKCKYTGDFYYPFDGGKFYPASERINNRINNRTTNLTNNKTRNLINRVNDSLKNNKNVDTLYELTDAQKEILETEFFNRKVSFTKMNMKKVGKDLGLPRQKSIDHLKYKIEHINEESIIIFRKVNELFKYTDKLMGEVEQLIEDLEEKIKINKIL